MRLLEDYRLRYHISMWLLLLPLIPYFISLGSYIYDLVAGGILFFYFTAMMALLNRYFKTYVSYRFVLKKGKESRLELKRLHPRHIIQGNMSGIDLIKVQVVEIISVFIFQALMLLLAYISKNVYLINFAIGSSILSLSIFWKNLAFIIKAVTYKDCVFNYETGTLRIWRRV